MVMRQLLQLVVAEQIQSAVAYMAAVAVPVPRQIKRRHRRSHAGIAFVAHCHFENMRIGLIKGLQHNLTDILFFLLMAQAVRCSLKGFNSRPAGDFACRIASHAVGNGKKIGLAYQQRIFIILSDQAHMGSADYLHYFCSCSLANLARS